ncbi:sphingomyelin phosphodiesterase-like [Xenia sp. Carnegie-2017]|uniref:sphingomyelin phosphodiesterase-like n=1 Tax=Xenia sp. Carnegie-2017 TaxID=2897299 RepID=UPI001F04976D|nr:sphingomyelin phosphodiesterase-like [Xenia sp. Carnegie-2017]
MKRWINMFLCVLLFNQMNVTFPAPSKAETEKDDKLDSLEYGGVSAGELLAYSERKELLNYNSNKFNSLTSRNKLECDACKFLTDFVQSAFHLQNAQTDIQKAALNLCIKLKIEDTRVCKGVIPEFQNEVLTVFDKVFLDPNQICGLVIGPSCGKVRSLYPSWNVTLPNVAKPYNSLKRQSKPGLPTLTILHLSDVHIDRQYAENTSTECGEPLCCRKYNGKGKAGYWGSYKCDIPMRTFEAALKRIKKSHPKIDLVYWTGDVPPHDIWNQSRTDQIKAMESAVKLFIKYFPDIKVYPAMGNHESAPVNSFPPPFVTGKSSNKWLLDSFADFWSFWLPEHTGPTIRRGGYYTVLHSKGFRIISLNDNYCNNQNWWLLINSTDPAGQLQWLIKVLQAAEDNHEKVHIISHIPIGTSSCLKYWSWNYYRIINRYENIITGQFLGHTHQDHFEIFYDLQNKSRAINVAYIGPSLTTYPNLNPGYRLYTVDGNHAQSTYAILDHSTYYLDLVSTTKENLVWKFEYSAKEAYEMASLEPAAWDDFVTRLGKNYTLFQTYFKYKYKCSPYREKCTSRACIVGELCGLRSGRSHDDHYFCRNVTKLEYNL